MSPRTAGSSTRRAGSSGKTDGKAGARRTTGQRSVADRHRAWLQLVDTDGPFLAVPPLKRVWTEGMPQLGRERLDALRDAKPAFEKAYDDLSALPVGDEGREAALAAYRTYAPIPAVAAVPGRQVPCGWCGAPRDDPGAGAGAEMVLCHVPTPGLGTVPGRRVAAGRRPDRGPHRRNR